MAKAATDSSVFGRGTRLTGRVSGEGGLLVEGQIAGNVSVTGPLVIADSASVEGDVEAESLEVEGTLLGDAAVRGPIHIRAGATVRGALRGSRVSVAAGASVALRLDTEFELDLDGAARPQGKAAGGARRR